MENLTMCRTLALASLLLSPIICFAASHEEVLRLNTEQKGGSEVVCHAPLNIIVNQKPLTLDFKNSMTVISNVGNNRTYQVIATFIPSGTNIPVITQRYLLNVITDETGQTHKIDPNSIIVTSPYSTEMAQKNESQLRSAPESYQSDSMVTVTDFPNFTIQGYENGPVTRCSISTERSNG
ncbi:hypothetical protein [Citrobacter telavivensis]